jgi:hypothetical protein
VRQSDIGAGALPRFNLVVIIVSTAQKLCKKAVGKVTVKNNNLPAISPGLMREVCGFSAIGPDDREKSGTVFTLTSRK